MTLEETVSELKNTADAFPLDLDEPAPLRTLAHRHLRVIEFEGHKFGLALTRMVSVRRRDYYHLSISTPEQSLREVPKITMNQLVASFFSNPIEVPSLLGDARHFVKTIV